MEAKPTDFLNHDSYKSLGNHRVLIQFRGVIYAETLSQLSNFIHTAIREETKIKKIFAVFTALTQNIFHYSMERVQNPDGTTSGVGMIHIIERPEGYYITSGNYIQNSKVHLLEDKINSINELTPELKKSLYIQNLSKRLDGSKEPGIGLIDVARKTDAPLEFNFEAISEDKSFFVLTGFFQKDEDSSLQNS